jgi:hypothetical protein
MRQQHGSVIPYVAVLLFALVLSVQYVYSAYKVSNESTRLQNTADAGAYSAAATVAQSYNFQALSNRAMVANQITVAQLTTMTSWVRMLRTFAGTIYSLTQYIPYVGEVTYYIDTASDDIQTAVEATMPALTMAVEIYLKELSLKQLAFSSTATAAVATEVVGEVVEKNDPDVDYHFATISVAAGLVAHAAAFERSDCKSEADTAKDQGADAPDNDHRFRCRQFRNVMLASKDGFTSDRLYELGLPGVGSRIPVSAPVALNGKWPGYSEAWLMRGGGTTMAGTSKVTPFDTWTSLDTISLHADSTWYEFPANRKHKDHGEIVKMGAGSAIAGTEGCGQCHFMHEGTAYWSTNPRASMCTDPWHEDNHHSFDPESISNKFADTFSTNELTCHDLREKYKKDISTGAYSGLQPFYDLKDQGLIQDRDHLMVYLRKDRDDLSAYSSTPFGRGADRDQQIDRHEGAQRDSLHAAAAATVTFRRDNDRWMLASARRLDGRIEFGNLYNPFWEARLDPLSDAEKSAVIALKYAP